MKLDELISTLLDFDLLNVMSKLLVGLESL